LDEKVKVYNFEVEGNHNYYVSEKGILVHNNCAEELIGRMISQDSRIVKLARETFKSNKVLVKEAENLIMNLEKGNMNPGIGTKNVARDIFEARSRNGARVYFRNSGESVDILGYSDKSNQQKVINWILSNF
jgi:putative component of toxin-antitoxin plasmid stabilization module